MHKLLADKKQTKYHTGRNADCNSVHTVQ